MAPLEHDAGLVVKNLHLAFGGLQVLSDVSVSFQPGRITGLIGPNGAGKTSFFNCLTGLYSPDSGDILLDGQSLRGVSTARRAKLGIARTFQHVALAPELSVVENIIVGLHATRNSGIIDALVPLPSAWSDRDACHEKALSALAAVGLSEIAEYPAGQIAPGTLRLVELARAVVGSPRLLLLDEPAAGLNSSETHDLIDTLRKFASKDLIMVVVEHDMDLIMQTCDTINVLNFGVLIASGTPAEIQSNPTVAEVYLGVADA